MHSTCVWWSQTFSKIAVSLQKIVTSTTRIVRATFSIIFFKKMIKTMMLLTLFSTCIMWLTSYSHYTSIGIDRDVYEKNKISHSYYRLRWPGNGSMWFGRGTSYRSLNSHKPFEQFDLAATFLDTNFTLPEVKSYYNKWGFWLISLPNPRQQFWLGIPAWLPVLLNIILFIVFLRNTKTPKVLQKM